MRKPIKIGSAKFLKLQHQWYKKVERSGHVDVERYIDMNKLPVSTMPRLHGSFIYDPESDEISDEAEFIPLSDTDKAGFWREVGRKASKLPVSHELYKLVNAFAELGSFSAAARACSMERAAAVRMLRKWLGSHGLKEATGLSRRPHDPPPPPAPVRTLSKAEIAALDLTPPKKLR